MLGHSLLNRCRDHLQPLGGVDVKQQPDNYIPTFEKHRAPFLSQARYAPETKVKIQIF